MMQFIAASAMGAIIGTVATLFSRGLVRGFKRGKDEVSN